MGMGLMQIGLESNPWVMIPAKDVINMNSTVEDEAMSARGNCYPSCLQGDIPEITLHSIMGFGSRNVKKMKILKLTNGDMAKPCDNCKSDALIYNENHVNTRYQTFKVIRPTKIEPLQRKISLSTECTYKLGNSWKHGFHTSCEAFVYYYPYHNKMPSKCVSQPDETKVKTAIKTAFNITLPENVAINDTVSILRQRTEFMKSQKTTVEPSALLKAFGDITSTGQCSFSQIDEDKKDLVQLINDKLKSLPRFNYSSYTIFDRQQCKAGMIQRKDLYTIRKSSSIIPKLFTALLLLLNAL